MEERRGGEAYKVLRDVDFHGFIRKTEDAGDLTHTVRAVVEEEQRIVVYQRPHISKPAYKRAKPTIGLTLNPTLTPTKHNRLQKLIRLIPLIRLLNTLHQILALLTLALDQPIHRDLDPLPPLIPIHSIVSSHSSCDGPNLLLLDEGEEVFGVGCGGTRGGVAAITEEVDVDVGDADFFGGFEECVEVVDVGVDATVGDLIWKTR